MVNNVKLLRHAPAAPMAPIDKLSWEELDLVLSFVPKNDDDPSLQFGFDAPKSSLSLLPLYATVCKEWSFHFEQRIFNSLKVKSNELGELSRIVKGHRATPISRLEYHIILPTYSEHACARFERKTDQNLNDGVFTDAIHGLFWIMKGWEMKQTISQDGKHEGSTHEMNPRSFELLMGDIYSPMDGTYRGKEKYREDRLQWELGKRYVLGGLRSPLSPICDCPTLLRNFARGLSRPSPGTILVEQLLTPPPPRHDLWNCRWDHSFLQLHRFEDLPAISSVSRFSSGPCTRNVAPGSMAMMTSKFTNIKHIVLVSPASQSGISCFFRSLELGH